MKLSRRSFMKANAVAAAAAAAWAASTGAISMLSRTLVPTPSTTTR